MDSLQFFELLQVIDSVVDHSKLDHSEDGEVEAQMQAALSEQDNDSPERKGRTLTEAVAQGLDEDDEEEDEDDDLDGDEDEGGAANEEEIVEMVRSHIP